MNFINTHHLRTAFLAHSLEALASEIVRQGEMLLQDEGVEFPARASSAVLLLGERAGLSAADLAALLDQPHQLVTQRIELLVSLGIVARVIDPDDARRKTLRLTRKGKQQFELLNQALLKAEEAFGLLFAEIGCDLSAVAGRASAALRGSQLSARVTQADASP